jgi:hypothetical protein
MRRPKLSTISRLFDTLLVEKQSLAEKERGMIVKLNKVLAQIGYRVERDKRPGMTTSRPSRRLRPQRRRAIFKSTDSRATDHGRKRRGRPALRRVA